METPVPKISIYAIFWVNTVVIKFQNCVASLTNQEHYNSGDQDEVKTSNEWLLIIVQSIHYIMVSYCFEVMMNVAMQ